MSRLGEICHCWERCGWTQDWGWYVRPDALRLQFHSATWACTQAFTEQGILLSMVQSGNKHETPRHWKAPGVTRLPTGRAWDHRRKDLEEWAFLKSSKSLLELWPRGKPCALCLALSILVCHCVSSARERGSGNAQETVGPTENEQSTHPTVRTPRKTSQRAFPVHHCVLSVCLALGVNPALVLAKAHS